MRQPKRDLMLAAAAALAFTASAVVVEAANDEDGYLPPPLLFEKPVDKAEAPLPRAHRVKKHRRARHAAGKRHFVSARHGAGKRRWRHEEPVAEPEPQEEAPPPPAGLTFFLPGFFFSFSN